MQIIFELLVLIILYFRRTRWSGPFLETVLISIRRKKKHINLLYQTIVCEPLVEYHYEV